MLVSIFEFGFLFNFSRPAAFRRLIYLFVVLFSVMGE